MVALEVGIINRYFDKDGDIDPEDENDLRSVNWPLDYSSTVSRN
jgi:hypothetical protein